MPKPEPVLQVVAIGDTHCGSELGLCPRRFRKDGGSIHIPSRVQRSILRCWEFFWKERVPKWVGDRAWHLVHNGDAIDGDHHGSTQQVTHNLASQRRMFVEMMRPIVAACRKSGGRYFQIRGTEAHVGATGECEEEIAQDLDAEANEDGDRSRWDLNLRLGKARINFLHHIGTVSSQAYEATALGKELAEHLIESARTGIPHADLLVRSHRHRNSEVGMPSGRGRIRCLVLPAWQAKTSFAWKTAGARQSNPQIGGAYIRLHPTAGLYTAEEVWFGEPSREVQ